MNILNLTLKKKWFDMILSGVKKEEYREVKTYWNVRLLRKKYDAIRFTNGYGKDKPSFVIELKEILRSLGIIEWGAPEGQIVYILKLGKITDRFNLMTSNGSGIKPVRKLKIKEKKYVTCNSRTTNNDSYIVNGNL